MIRSLLALPLALAGALAATLTVHALASRPLDASAGAVSARFTQMGVDVEGRFTRYQGEVAFDPANPASGQVTIEIDTASFDIGDDSYNAEVRKAEWLDAKTHPQARFRSREVKALGGDRYEALGTLSLKGREQSLRVPFRLVVADGASRVEGEVPISRKAFAIGSADWDEVLDDRVTVLFRLTLPPA